MRWDRFFEDLEDQLASEWEAERISLDTEAERLRLSKVALRDRLAALVAGGADDGGRVAVDVCDGALVTGSIVAAGLDWLALEHTDVRPGAPAPVTLIPVAAIHALGLPHADVLRSARPAPPDARPPLAARMSLGFVLRDVARRRVPVRAGLDSGRVLTGTIDRAGADHLDLALHEPGAPRRSAEVTGHRLVPFAALAWVRIEAPGPLPFG